MTTNLNRKEQSHERIVEVAARAIRRAGYHGVGVADIMKEAGLTHGGFYAHFASRDALLVEAMQQASRENRVELSASMARRMAKRHSRFSAFVWSYLHDSHLDSAEHGCVVAALSSEMKRQGKDVQQEARRRVKDLVAFVRTTLPDGVDAGQAEVITATMVGALQLARTLGGHAGRSLLAQTREALLQQYQPVSLT
jgi:TetR/AcrR family transcriptional regulator, transcriptional repressor for nem operon